MRRVSDVMTSDVKTVTSTEVVGPVRDMMLDGKIHSAPVVDDKGSLVGIITSHDLVEEWAPGQGVATVMTDKVATVGRDTTIVDAARRMLDHHIHHLVVLVEGRPVGVVSSFDLLSELAGEVEAQKSSTLPARRQAQAGDLIVIRGHAVGSKERRATIVEAQGDDGGPPYLVHWHDDPHDEPHDVLFFPGSDATVEPQSGAD
jgi:CBS domain-containing protein